MDMRNRTEHQLASYMPVASLAVFLRESVKSGGLTLDEIAQITAFRHSGNSEGYLLIRGVDVGHIPPTPQSRQHINKPDITSEMALLQASVLMGDPVGYQQESFGDVINNFFPHQSEAKSSTSDSCDSELEMHTENAFHPVQPDYLLLLCLRHDPQQEAITYISSIDNILPKLTEGEIAHFQQCKYNFLSDYSEEGKNCRININNWQTVLYGSHDNPLFRYDPAFMESKDPLAQQKLERLTQLTWETAVPVRLKQGDLLIVDNRKTTHARSPFPANFDGKDRWIQRSFVVCNQRLIGDSDKNKDGVITLTIPS